MTTTDWIIVAIAGIIAGIAAPPIGRSLVKVFTKKKK